MSETPDNVSPENEPTARMPTAQVDADASEDTPAAESGTSENPVETIGEFHLIRRLGKGGMAEVWLAEQSSLKRHVALKLLRRDLTQDDTYVKRFQTEAKASAGLNHPNIVQVYTVGQEDGQHYIAQEYVQGQTLRNLLQKKGPLTATAALHIIRQVAAGLQAAADRGIVHRDIKPENIMITRKGEVKVADFGLAQQTQGDQLHLTQEGITMGTPLYMSPEQVKGRKLDHRSDIYSLGVTCYHMLAGRPPFEGATAVTVAVQHLNDEPEPLASIRSDLPPQLCEMVERMMAKKPEDRYADAKAVLQDARRLLKALKEGGPEGEVSIKKLSSPSIEASSRLNRRAIVWRSIACVLIGGAAAGLGWWLRTPNLMAVVKPSELKVVPEATAEQQYIKAMFRGDEQGFLAVQQLFPNDDFWCARAAEQLALLYLQDPNREAETQEQLDKLVSYSINGDKSYAWEAKVGNAVLAANKATNSVDWRNVRAKLPSESDESGQSAGEPWHRMRRELSQQIDEALNEPDSGPAPSRPQPAAPPETPEVGQADDS